MDNQDQLKLRTALTRISYDMEKASTEAVWKAGEELLPRLHRELQLRGLLRHRQPSVGGSLRLDGAFESVESAKLLSTFNDLKYLYYGPFNVSGVNPSISVASGVVALMRKTSLKQTDEGRWLLKAKLLRNGWHFCGDEPMAAFQDQPVAARFSGFLARENVVVTSGHFLQGDTFESPVTFEDMRVVFGFRDAAVEFDASQIYEIASIKDIYQDKDVDWAVLELASSVPPTVARPLEFRAGGQIATKQTIYMVGHPMGLPQKLASSAEVRTNNLADAFFCANLDAYDRESGAPVFNADDNVVEGILVGGKADFFESAEGCWRSINLSNEEGAEKIVRVTQFASLL